MASPLEASVASCTVEESSYPAKNRRGISNLTPAERSQRARIAAQTLHSRVDSREHTKPARAALQARFENEVDPDRVLPEAERKRRADSARKAHLSRMAYRSSVARRKAREYAEEAQAADEALEAGRQ